MVVFATASVGLSAHLSAQRCSGKIGPVELPDVRPARHPGLEIAEFTKALVVFESSAGRAHFLRDAHARLFMACDGIRPTGAVVAELVEAGFGSESEVRMLISSVLGELDRMGVVDVAVQVESSSAGADDEVAPARISFPASGYAQATPVEPATVDRAVEIYQRNGSLLMENSFEPGLVQAMQTDFLQNYASRPIEEVTASSLRVGHGRFMFSVDLRAPYMDPAVYAPARVMPIVKALLGDDCVIQSIGVVCAYPGSQAQHVHRDHPALFPSALQLGATAPPYALHLVVPLVDLDEVTGTTALWDGSHRALSDPGEREAWARAGLDGATTPWPKLGDSYLMDFRLRHGGTPNRSDRPRPLLYIVYSRAWFQDRANFDKQQRLLVGADEFERIPSEHRRLFDDARPDRWPTAARGIGSEPDAATGRR